ncbi:17111_t:CDS:2 [Gigaspora margarita]|uniref:17111_t:CDS:1 n=1 Tax=Gigaspora margarita TaxID=4874 RepID=A0ABN7UJ18_GIGMA|nr:17111_t:CDS:2 [Gigaspora margarita]
MLNDKNKLRTPKYKVKEIFSNLEDENICVVSGVPDIEHSKRQYLGNNYEEEQSRNVKKIQEYPSPSSFANINNFREYQIKDQEFLIYHPFNCIGIPLILYNSSFANSRQTLTIRKARQQEFNQMLQELFDGNVIILKSDDNAWNDGCQCDPTTQAAAFYAKFYAHESHEQALKMCNLPCFIIGLAGPWICVLGAVYVEKPLIEPLTGFEPLIFINDRIHLEKIARLFMALRMGYLQRFLPYIRKVKDVGSIVYKEKLFKDPLTLLWKAETADSRQKIIVKFSHKYHKIAHQMCFEIGKAPELFYISNTHNGFCMIIMGYVEGQRLCDCDDLDNSEYKKIIDDVEKAILHLHSKDIVFADLRECNIFVIKDESGNYNGMLLDFDWAGKDNVECYPSFMNHEIDWPKGAEDKEKLKKEHDIYWLKVLKNMYLKN